MFITFINWVLAVSGGLGYQGILILMAVESSFLPLPSELVIPPAAWLASLGQMNVFLIIIAGTLGSMLGATINYYLSRWLGRLVIYGLIETRLAKIIRLKKSDLEKTEQMFLKNAKQATFVGRLIPVVRHLISIPAGFTKMPYGSFILFTALGSAIWVSILTILGYTLGANQELLIRYYKEIQWLLIAIGVSWLYFFLRRNHKKRKNKKLL